MADDIEMAPVTTGPGLGGSIRFFRDLGLLIANVVAAFWAVTAVWNDPSLGLRLTVFGVIVLVTVFFGYIQLNDKLIVPWRAKRNLGNAIQLPEVDESRSTIFRLQPYGKADQEEFFPPGESQKPVLTWLKESESTYLYLTGISGTGKTSLLQAWLIPKLVALDRPAAAMVVRSRGNPIKQLEKVLRDRDTLPKEETDLRRLLQRAASTTNACGQRLLIVIDQFEECLILQSDHGRTKLTQFFSDLQKKPIKNLQFLFVLRTENLKFEALTALGLPNPRLGENWFELKALTYADARTSLRRTPHKLSETMENEIIEEAKVVDELPGMIRPITLNMMGTELKRFAGTQLTETTPGKLFQDFLQKAMAKPGTDDIAPQLLAEMIPDEGIGKQCTEKELAAATGFTQAATSKTLHLLSEEGLVRELDHTKNIWEISHDFIVLQLRQIVSRSKPSYWQRIQRAATPVAAVSWIMILVAGYPLYQEWRRDARAMEILRAEGISVSEEKDAHEVTFNHNTKSGAMDRVFAYVEALNPTKLTIQERDSITSLPSLDKLQSLKSLSIYANDQLASLPSFDQLQSLTSLAIRANPQLEGLPNLDRLQSLSNLTIYANDQLKVLENLDQLHALESLTISNNDQLGKLPELDNLKALRKLTIQANDRLTKLPNLDQLHALKSLIIGNNDQLREFKIGSLKGLTSLVIRGNDQLTSIFGLEKVQSLTSLTISRNNHLAALPNLSQLSTLSNLTISGNGQLTTLPSLEASKSLNKVHIWGNDNLSTLPALGDLSRFKVVAFDAGNDIFASIAVLKGLPETTLVRAHSDFIQQGYHEQLNKARYEIGLPPVKVEPF